MYVHTSKKTKGEECSQAYAPLLTTSPIDVCSLGIRRECRAEAPCTPDPARAGSVVNTPVDVDWRSRANAPVTPKTVNIESDQIRPSAGPSGSRRTHLTVEFDQHTFTRRSRAEADDHSLRGSVCCIPTSTWLGMITGIRDDHTPSGSEYIHGVDPLQKYRSDRIQTYSLVGGSTPWIDRQRSRG